METGDMVGADLRRVAARKFLVNIFFPFPYFLGIQLNLDILG